MTIGLVIVSALSAFGCESSRWSREAAAKTWPPLTPPSSHAAAYPATTTPEAPEPLPAPGGREDPQALEGVIAEVHRLRTLDPAAEEQLLESLRQTPPDLWPLVVYQVRAAVAYRRQAAQGRASGQPPETASQAVAAGADVPAKSSGPPRGVSPRQPYARTGTGPATPTGSSPPGQAVAANLAPPARPGGAPPEASAPPAPDVPPSKTSDQGVVHASYAERESDSWQAHLAEAVSSLESKVSPAPESPEQIAEHARLRMLYLAAGRRDEALKPIPAVAAGTQDFWSNELYGLAALLDGASSASPSRLAAEAQRPLDEAVTRLAESCPLVLSNLAFVTEVQSYGVFKRFEKYEFTPGQKLLLYAEVDNFECNETPQGFHTALKSSYQIFDSGGRRVAEHEFATNEEYCRNRRRDFFIGYEFSLPERIYPGKHVLKLTVEDVNSAKVGQSSIEFTVKASGE